MRAEIVGTGQITPALRTCGTGLVVFRQGLTQSLLSGPQSRLESEYAHFYAQPDLSET
jgi:hypothetical protein